MDERQNTEELGLLSGQQSPIITDLHPPFKRDPEGFIIPSDADFEYLLNKYNVKKAVRISFQDFVDPALLEDEAKTKNSMKEKGAAESNWNSSPEQLNCAAETAGGGDDNGILRAPRGEAKEGKVGGSDTWGWKMLTWVSPVFRISCAAAVWFILLVLLPMCNYDRVSYAYRSWESRNFTEHMHLAMGWVNLNQSFNTIMCPEGQVYDQYSRRLSTVSNNSRSGLSIAVSIEPAFTQCFRPLDPREKFCESAYYWYTDKKDPSMNIEPGFHTSRWVWLTFGLCWFFAATGAMFSRTGWMLSSGLLLDTTAAEVVARERSHQGAFVFRSWEPGSGDNGPTVVSKKTFNFARLTPFEIIKLLHQFPIEDRTEARPNKAPAQHKTPNGIGYFWNLVEETFVRNNSETVDKAMASQQSVMCSEDISLPIHNWARSRKVELHNQYNYRFADEETYQLFLSGFELFYTVEIPKKNVSFFDISVQHAMESSEYCLVRRGPKIDIPVREDGVLNRRPADLPIQFQHLTEGLQGPEGLVDPSLAMGVVPQKTKWNSNKHFPYSMPFYAGLILLCLDLVLSMYISAGCELYTMRFRKVIALNTKVMDLKKAADIQAAAALTQVERERRRMEREE